MRPAVFAALLFMVLMTIPLIVDAADTVLTDNLELRLTVPVGGGVLLGFEDALSVSANITSSRPEGNYTLNVRAGMVDFSVLTVGPYVLEVKAVFREPAWRILALRVYSREGIVGLDTRIPVYASNITFIVVVNAVSIPHYPTPEEIAKAQYKLFNLFASKIVNATLQDNVRTRLELRELKKQVLESQESLGRNMDRLSNSLRELAYFIDLFKTNIYVSFLMVVAIVVGIALLLYIFYRSLEEAEPIREVKVRRRRREDNG